MLVLGSKVRFNGLGTSLLKRLHNLYNNLLGSSGSNPYTGKELHVYSLIVLYCSMIEMCKRVILTFVILFSSTADQLSLS